jgi:hypothetical protein
MEPPWTIRCYVSAKGVDEIRAWYERQPCGVQAKFLSRLTALVGLDVKDWSLPLFRWLRGDGASLGELRFEVQKVQHRPLGFRAGERVFTLTFCATEKSNKFVPSNACAIALARKAEIENDPRRSIVCWLRFQ